MPEVSERREKRNRKGQRGAAMIEGALVMLPFMAMMVGVVNLSLNFFLAEALQDRAYAAVRYAALNPGDSTSVRNMMLYGTVDTPEQGNEEMTPSPTYLGLTASDVIYQRNNIGTPAETVTVGVENYKLPMIIPGAAKTIVGRRITATIPVESP